MNVFMVLLCRGGGGINEWERLKARVEDWRLTGGWVEGGGAAKVKVEATPPPPHLTIVLSCTASVAYFANMTGVPFTLPSLANVFSIRSTRNMGQRTDILFVGLCGAIFWTIDIYSPARDDGEE